RRSMHSRRRSKRWVTTQRTTQNHWTEPFTLRKCLKRMAGTTGLEPAASAVTGQRSNQLNYVPNLFSYLYRKPASLVAFLRFNRFACVACFNPVEPNSEFNQHHEHQEKPCNRQTPTKRNDTSPE